MVFRAVVVVFSLAAVAITAVHLRAEQARAVARALRSEAEWIDLRRELWDLQVRAARLRAPDRVHHWMDAFGGAPEERSAPTVATGTGKAHAAGR